MRVPNATYRLQFNSGFTFRDALEIVGYLDELGISDIYASPIFCARKGSIHGYDMVDPTCVNPEIGTMEDFAELTASVKERRMGWLQDIVPNHMAYDGQNPMLMDIFENGTFSPYYRFFDIDWDHAYESMKGRLLAPFLGKPYGQSLEAGEIRIVYEENGFTANYYSLRYPLRIESYAAILTPNLARLKEVLGTDHPDYIKFMGIIFTLKGFPCQEMEDERPDQIRFIKRMLWEIYNGSKPVKEFIDSNLRFLNGETCSNDFSAIDQLLYQQFFRLSFWKVASEEINYRRFFSINELISLNMGDIEVFEHCHGLVFKMVEEGVFTGLRIDHIDGLGNPLLYLKRLADKTNGIYMTVEKILAIDEGLPSNWPVQGTTGYDFVNHLNGIFCKKENEAEFNRIYSSIYGGAAPDREVLLHDKKAIIIEHFMTGDVDNLAHLMKRISSKDRGGGDITLHGLRRAIFEVLSFFPVYRTYICPESLTGVDRKYITEAVEMAKRKNRDLVNEIEYLAKFLLLRYEDYLGEEEKADWLSFVMRFQQFSGPLMAKGFEDTLLYDYNRLVSLNEVGGEPFRFGIALPEFHAFNEKRAQNWPYDMNATSTHDTKRDEDVRARINVLSEIPGEWEERVRLWGRMNLKHKNRAKGLEMPAPNDEYLLYQTLVGAYPFGEFDTGDFIRRIQEYVIKAIREAKVHTDWIKPDSEYEQAFESFVEQVLNRSQENDFLRNFIPFQKKVAHFGVINSLAQVLLKTSSPGISDFYQGSELWEFRLVDPDNRRQVDYRRRKSLLDSIAREQENPDFLKLLLATPQDGRIKLFLTQRCLMARKNNRNLFKNGSYIPLSTGGRFSDHVVAFARREDSAWSISITPRFCTGLIGENEYPCGENVWRDTYLELPEEAPPGWADAVTGAKVGGSGRLSVGAALSGFPVALLISSQTGGTAF